MRRKARKPVNSKTRLTDARVLGIDPDVNNVGVCLIEDGKMQLAELIPKNMGVFDPRFGMALALSERLSWLLEGEQYLLVVIEWPQIRKDHPRKNDIKELTAIAGVCLGLVACYGHDVLRPIPVEWKGSVKKEIHQPRILRAYAAQNDFDSFTPEDLCPDVPPEQRNHVVDALGLAMWGAQS